MRHGRLPWPLPDELGDQAARVHEAITGGPRASGPRLFQIATAEGRLEGPFNSMLVAPEVGWAMQELGAAIRYRTSLANRTREVAILALASERSSDYEAYAHEAVGAACGLTADELAALRAGTAPESLSEEERLVHRTCRSLLTSRSLSDSDYQAAVAALGEAALMEVVMLVGYYDSLDLMMSAFQAPLPAGVDPLFAHPTASESDGS